MTNNISSIIFLCYYYNIRSCLQGDSYLIAKNKHTCKLILDSFNIKIIVLCVEIELLQERRTFYFKMGFNYSHPPLDTHSTCENSHNNSNIFHSFMNGKTIEERT